MCRTPCFSCLSQLFTIPFYSATKKRVPFAYLSVPKLQSALNVRNPLNRNVQVSLWTQTEVFGALRDMARGRWLTRGEQSKQVSGLFGGDQDACCVQAFTKSARFTDGGDNNPRGGVGVGVLKTRIVDGGGNQSRRERRMPPEDNGLSGPKFYRAAWRRTGDKLLVWKITSRWVY